MNVLRGLASSTPAGDTRPQLVERDFPAESFAAILAASTPQVFLLRHSSDSAAQHLIDRAVGQAATTIGGGEQLELFTRAERSSAGGE